MLRACARLYFGTSSLKFSWQATRPVRLDVLRNYVVTCVMAKKMEGQLSVVLEDCQGKDMKQEAVDKKAIGEKLLGELEWLGLPATVQNRVKLLRQSQRLQRYKNVQKELVEKQLAYPCFCLQDKTKQAYNGHCRELSLETVTKKIIAGERFRIRFRNNLPLKKVKDSVYGELRQQKQDQIDFVIAGSDQRPTLRFMRIIDSVDVGLTQYIMEHKYLEQVWNTLAIFDALKLPDLRVMHLPPIKYNPVDPSLWLSWLKQHDYSPKAIINAVALLGWQPFGTSLENKLESLNDFFTLEEIVAYFEADKVTKEAVYYSKHKLDELNRKYLATELKDLKLLAQKLAAISPKANALSNDKLKLVSEILASKKMVGWWELSNYRFLFERPTIDQEFNKDYFKLFGYQHSQKSTLSPNEDQNQNLLLLSKLKAVFEDQSQNPSAQTLAKQVSTILSSTKIPNEKLFGMLRLAVTGRNRPRLHLNILRSCSFLGPREVFYRLSEL